MLALAFLAAVQHGIQIADMDPSVKPAGPDTLYRFADGGWLDRNKLPPDKPYIGTFDFINDHNLDVLHTVAEKASRRRAPLDTPQGMVGLLYREAMDEKRADALGAKPIAGELTRIARVQTPADVITEIAWMDSLGLAPGFSAGVNQDDKDATRMLFVLGQGGLSLPDREFYLQSDERSKAMRTQLVKSSAKLLGLAGLANGQGQAEQMLAIETELARISSTPVELRDLEANYHLMKARDLRALTPGISWSSYFETVGTGTPKVVNVNQPKFLRGFAKLVKDRPVAEWRSYLRCQLIQAVAPYLSKPFVDERFHLTEAVSGVTANLPRWKRAVNMIDGSVGEALGRLYVQAAFPGDAKAKALRLVLNVKSALRERIKELDWMGAATKTQALHKLDSMAIKVGYPDHWRDYSNLHLKDDSWVQNLLRAGKFEWNRSLRKLGHPIDRSEWGMTPPTVNAYYNPYWNEIVFPAGILQPGFFDAKADDASNYGGIGAVIGHEMTHGFDDQGSQFDAKGNRKNWWTPEDNKRFKAKADQIVAQYDAYTSPEGLKVNGKLTLGENIADIGGLAIAHLAYEKSLAGRTPEPIDGYNGEQRFFIAWGQNYRAHIRPEMAKIWIATDPHSPDSIRVQGGAADNANFYKAFGLAVPEHLPGLW